MRSECSFLRFTNGGNLKVFFTICFYFIDKSVAHFSFLQVFFFSHKRTEERTRISDARFSETFFACSKIQVVQNLQISFSSGESPPI